MKRYIAIMIIAVSFFITGQSAYSQVPPPPPSGGHGQSGNQQSGGGAPIGGGLGILLALGAAYGGKKVLSYMRFNDKLEE
jgi:hypothetical protein